MSTPTAIGLGAVLGVLVLFVFNGMAFLFMFGVFAVLIIAGLLGGAYLINRGKRPPEYREALSPQPNTADLDVIEAEAHAVCETQPQPSQAQPSLRAIPHRKDPTRLTRRKTDLVVFPPKTKKRDANAMTPRNPTRTIVRIK